MASTVLLVGRRASTAGSPLDARRFADRAGSGHLGDAAERAMHRSRNAPVTQNQDRRRT